MKKWITFLIVVGILLGGCTGGAVTAAPEVNSPTPVPPGSPTPVEANTTSAPSVVPDNSSMPSAAVNTPVPTANLLPATPVQTQPGGKGLTHADVYLDKVEVLMQGSNPVQPMLNLQGSLPTPCNKLQVEVGKPDSDNRIQVQVFSQVDPNQICAQVLVSFTKSVPLGNLSSGKYTVWVNGEQSGNIDMP
jgi:hypothetical protein